MYFMKKIQYSFIFNIDVLVYFEEKKKKRKN